MKKIIGLFIILIIIFSYLFTQISPTTNNKTKQIITFDRKANDVIALKLQREGFIKNYTIFSLLLFIKGNNQIEPGGYYLSKNMNAFQIISNLNEGPDLAEILVYEGIRKEQIGESLQKKLNWNNNQLEEWNNLNKNTDYYEGVYFPDKYLIPINENPEQVSKRMINNFNEKFTPYAKEAEEKNIRWTTVLKVASLLEREAGGPSDMPLISGIIWNRLDKGEKLDIDATIQYAKGKTDGKWWGIVYPSDIQNSDSLYNTYKYRGLPPTPIANPGVTAIKAAINPEETDCIFYLHDKSRKIHCSVTYEEHLKNIDYYLN